MQETNDATLSERICETKGTLKLVFYFGIAGITITLPFVVFLKQGTASHVVAVIDLIGLVVLTGTIGAILTHCE